jgi:hypothetical protein
VIEANVDIQRRVLWRPVGADNEEGNWVRWRPRPAGTGCGIHRDWHPSLDEIFEKKLKILKK